MDVKPTAAKNRCSRRFRSKETLVQAANAMSRQAWTVILAGGLILFLSIGARQGFGLFFAPLSADLGLSREAFARAVAFQYLLWGLAGPIAGLLAERYSPVVVLVAGGTLYAMGFFGAGLVAEPATLLLPAGLLIGLGLGGAHFGVVNAAVVQVVPAARRGSALGRVAALTALGQLFLLFFTQGTIDALGWRAAMGAHALLVLLIVPLAIVLGVARREVARPAPQAEQTRGTKALSQALRTPVFWLLSIGFAFSGLQVMFTMTHLPALVSDLGMSADHAVAALAAVSASSFVGSWWFGRLCDRVPAQWLLVFIYLARAAMAGVAWCVPFTPASLVVYFSVLGLVWMCTIPVTSHLAAQLFGVKALASIYGAIFLAHQVGGFAGTWLGGVVFDRTGGYAAMWLLIVVLCSLGAILASMVRSQAMLDSPQRATASKGR